MPDTHPPAVCLPLCDRAARLSCAMVDALSVGSLRFAERARLRRILRRTILHLCAVERSLSDKGEAAPPYRD